jgi:hypothetical protein
MTHSVLEDIITSCVLVFEDWVPNIGVGIWKLHYSTWETVESYVFYKWKAGFEIVPVELRGRNM